jgi:anaerobic C4-dicarboxylate transporter DcuA
MDWRLILEFLVLIGVLAMGARMGGVGLGLWGAVGLLVL